MRDHISRILIICCLTVLGLACFERALFEGEQFGYRDAAHFYYPLYQRVQDDWNAGRWPLWEPEENGGMPLLGNPTAAVLYPLKVIYAAFPYPWAARLYVVVHTLIAFAGTYRLLRYWGTSPTGSGLAGLSYAFGAPILFQYCNIIYLVGAAWLPWGFQAVDRWLRLGRRAGLLELAVVLALETLGGDPEIAYVTGLCAGGYAIGLTWARKQRDRAVAFRFAPVIMVGLVLLVAWVVLTLFLAHWLPRFRPSPLSPPVRALPWMRYVPLGVALAWGLSGLNIFLRWRRGRAGVVLFPMLVGLAASAVLAIGLTAVQLFPVVEFTRQSARAADVAVHDIYHFSLEPVRLVEFLWPNAFGTLFRGNRSWLPIVYTGVVRAKIWVPSLYLGGPTILLALAAFAVRNGPPWRVWLSIVGVLSLVLAFGEYTSPIWWGRFNPEVRSLVGPHDPEDTTPLRQDLNLRDGDGSLYWFLATIVPGFKQFRFPSKLLSFTALAVAGLAGIGWDSARSGQTRRVLLLALMLALVSLFLAGLGLSQQGSFIRTLSQNGAKLASSFGPFDAAGAFQETVRSLVHSAVIACAFAFVLFRLGRGGRVQRYDALIMIVLTLDLALANVRIVLTVPQSDLEGKPELIKRIEDAEREKPAEGPFRIHRTPVWDPIAWRLEPSSNRVRDLVRWERATIQPKYGLGWGVEYTRTLGVAELYDYEWFFAAFYRIPSEQLARTLGAPVGEKMVVATRRGYDLWNTRYFVIPYVARWKEEHRGIASFLPDSERVYPPLDEFEGATGREKQIEWSERVDYQILRNLAAYPRAWVVHSVRSTRPIEGLDRESRAEPMMDMLYQGDVLWNELGRQVHDPRTVVWLDQLSAIELRNYLRGSPVRESETVKVTRHDSQQVELDVSLDSPGVVILADIYYPGWTLTIDGKPAPVYRANRMMRGAGVLSGKHHLVYTYRPASFRVGGFITIASLVFLALCCVAEVWRRMKGRAEGGSSTDTRPLPGTNQVLD